MASRNFFSYIVPAIIIIALLLVGGVIIYSNRGLLPFFQTASLKELVDEQDHIRGNPEAPVTIIEYSDFQCSFCARFHPVVQQVLVDFPDRIRWVYKHFPLDQIHPQAKPAAEASECAGEQGKFWEFSDGLFQNQSRLGKEFYDELALQLLLDINQFEDCIASRKYKSKVGADFKEGARVGVKGTPATLINGELLSGAVPYEALKSKVEEALNNL